MDVNTRLDLFNESMNKNWLYIFTYIIGVTAISIQYGNSPYRISNVMNGFNTLITTMFVGWTTHYVSHNVNYKTIYKRCLVRKYIKKKYRVLDWCLIRLCKILDFHERGHHDTTINKRLINVITEFVQNIITIWMN